MRRELGASIEIPVWILITSLQFFFVLYPFYESLPLHVLELVGGICI